MKKCRNMNSIDQLLRIMVGMLLIFLGFFNRDIISDPLLGMLIGVFGIINFGSGIVGVCPLYFMAGISTLKKITPHH